MQRDLKQRTFDFAVNVACAVSQLPQTVINRIYIGQIVRSSSSVGANYRASQRAKSDKDFLNKLKIVEEEADESVYFLQLLLALNPEHLTLLEPLISEGTEILKVIVASINKRKQNLRHDDKT